MEQSCPTCSYQNPSDSNFCMYCGNKLEITAISSKVSQFRFPSMRSLISQGTGNTGYNSPIGTGDTDNTEYSSPVGTGDTNNTEYSSPVSIGGTDNAEYNSSVGVSNIDNIEYNSPVGEGTGNSGYEALASSGSASNIQYDLPIGWITSNPAYDSPVGAVADNIGYGAPFSSERIGNIGYDLPANSDGAGNIGFALSAGSGAVSNSVYKPLVNSGYSSENNRQQPVQQALGVGASALVPAQLAGILGDIRGRLPRHAFAGRGSRMTHHSWLLEGEYLNAAMLHSAVVDLLSQRNSQTLKLNVEKLQERGHWAEERDYIVMQQGITSVFLYVAPAGQNLYISRTTTVQPPFNPFRIFLLIFALAEFLFGPSVLSHLVSSLTMHRSAETGIALIISFTVSILLIPSILFLVTFLFASLRHWFTQKDFGVYLRRNTLNDFEVDDILLLEHATDDAVRVAVDQLKLDATKIIPPVAGYQPRRRIRII